TDRLGHGFLRGPEHLHGLVGALDRDLGDQDRRRLAHEVRRQDRQQVAVTLLLVREGIGKGSAYRPILGTDEEINMANLVSVPGQRLADEHGHGYTSKIL